jgi:hypothetical protein
MSLNKTDLAFKKLINRQFSTPNRAFYQEVGANTLEVDAGMIYSSNIPESRAAAISSGVVRLMQCVLTKDYSGTVSTSSFYVISGSGYTVDSNNYNADFTTRGANYFSVSSSHVQRNFLSEKYGSQYAVDIRNSAGTQLSQDSSINWYFDYKSGVLHVADPSLSTAPYSITASQYIGTFLSTTFAGASVSASYITASIVSASVITASAIHTDKFEQGSVVNAVGSYSHAQGNGSVSYGSISHAEGGATVSSGSGAHSEGAYTVAFGEYSHAEGYLTRAGGDYSHAGGLLTTASATGQTVFGKYNVASSNTDDVFIVGTGTSISARSNMFVVNTTSALVGGNISASGHLILGSSPELLTYQKSKIRSDGALVDFKNIGYYINAESTGGFHSAFYDYVVAKDSNIRAGTIQAAFVSGSIVYNDVVTTDIGNTSEITCSAVLVTSTVRFYAYVFTGSIGSSPTNWTVKVMSRYV